MLIRQGDKFPSVMLKLVDAQGTRDVDSAALLASGKTVIFTVPGAFTPTCSNHHLPGYVDAAAQFRQLGVERIICATVNDHHVVKAWAQTQGALNEVMFFADFDATLAKACGLSQDKTAVGLGTRFERAAMIVKDGIVQHAIIDDAPGGVGSSGAPAILDVLKTKVASAA